MAGTGKAAGAASPLRGLAPHVQRAVQAGRGAVQPSAGPGFAPAAGARPLAPHVLAAIGAGIQPRAALPRLPGPPAAPLLHPPLPRGGPALPPPGRPGVVQRFRGVDLANASTEALGYVGSSAIEVQAMHVDGNVAMTANKASTLLTLSKPQQESLRDTLSALAGRVGTGLQGIKTSGTPENCSGKLQVKDHSLILLTGLDDGLHAEQRLLLSLAYLLRDGVKPDTVHVWGAKPPCGSCKAVLRAFSSAMDNVYDKGILFSGEAGQDRGAVGKLSLAAVFGGDQPGDFGRFIAMYERGIA